MSLSQKERLKALLDHLAVDELRDTPPGVGLKTVIEARDLGLIEIVKQGRTLVFCLTKAGQAARR
jgi:hypothetical protein